MNRPIWARNAAPWLKATSCLRSGVIEFPTQSPTMYTERKPLPPTTSAAPYPRAATANDATGANAATDTRASARDASAPIATPDDEPDPELLHDEQDEVGRPERRVLKPFDQADREGDGHRVVAAGLRLENPRQAAAERGDAQGGEDRRRVGGRHDGAEHQRRHVREVEEGVRGHARDQGGHQHPDRAEQRRREQHGTHRAPRRRQPALEEDDRQADHPERPREMRIVEVDAARAVRAEQHPEREEPDQHRHAEARGGTRGRHGSDEHGADDQQQRSGLQRRPPLVGGNEHDLFAAGTRQLRSDSADRG